MSHWDNWDNSRAIDEGWALFDWDGCLDLQRIDEDEIFDNDQDAIDYVRNEAEAGSEYHKRALQLHGTAVFYDERYSMVKSTDFECISASSDYIDIDCIVTCVDGSEWLFRTTYTRETGEITSAESANPYFSETEMDMFESPDPLRPCPDEVMEAYKQQYPEIIAEFRRRAYF